MGVRLGKLIKQARTDAGYTQEQLARKIRGVSATDISAYERGVSEPTQDTVKDIARATGVTQKSLLDAMPKSTSHSSSSSHSTASKSSMQVTATERRLVEAYRKATADERKRALAILRGNNPEFDDLMEGVGEFIGDMIFGKK